MKMVLRGTFSGLTKSTQEEILNGYIPSTKFWNIQEDFGIENFMRILSARGYDKEYIREFTKNMTDLLGESEESYSIIMHELERRLFIGLDKLTKKANSILKECRRNNNYYENNIFFEVDISDAFDDDNVKPQLEMAELGTGCLSAPNASTRGGPGGGGSSLLVNGGCWVERPHRVSPAGAGAAMSALEMDTPALCC